MKKLFLILLFFISIPWVSFACSMKSSVIDAAYESSVIFIGSVESIECSSDVKLSPEEEKSMQVSFSQNSYDIYKANFLVREVFIGENKKQILIQHASPHSKDTPCGYTDKIRFKKNEKYLVYALEDVKDIFTVRAWGEGGACGLTKIFPSIAAIEELSIISEPAYKFEAIAKHKLINSVEKKHD